MVVNFKLAAMCNEAAISEGDENMKRTEIVRLFKEAPEDGSFVTVAGWVKTSRESKNVGFLELNDGSCFANLQIIIDAARFDNFKELANLSVGSAVIVEGKVVYKAVADVFGLPYEPLT